VDIGNPDVRPAAKQAYLKSQTAQQARLQGAPLEHRRALVEEAEAAKLEAKRMDLVERLKLIGYLDAFYATRMVPYDTRLILGK
jgi:hypothetical protein